jgi:phosphoglycolate phosphatase
MNFKAVIFDLDGTLLNTLEDLANSMNSVLARFNFPGHDLEAYKYFVGEGIEMLVRRALPVAFREDQVIFEDCLAAMREEYGRRSRENTRPYDGIPQMLDKLSGMGVGMSILSNKPDDSTKRVVAELLPHWHFDVVLGERPSVPKKPDPAGAFEIAGYWGVPGSRILYLGDTSIDMLTANAAGMFAVGALWGFRKAEELMESGAKVLLDEPMGLLKLIAH